MSKGMGMEIFEDSCFQSIVFDHIRDKESCESNIFITEEGRFDIVFWKIVAYKEGSEVIGSRLQIGKYGISSPLSQVNNS